MKEYTKNLGKVVMTPKGAWSIEKEYEMLDIVYDSLTEHAYISKQEVPSGVDLSDSRHWMPLNVSGYSDSNVIALNNFNEDGEIQSYTLEEAIKVIKNVGRKSGAILIFYNNNVNRLDITTGCWEIWQFNSINVYDWENLDTWVNIYYNYNKFVGWYAADNTLNKAIPNPDIGCYAFVGNIYNEAFVYRCDVKNQWTKTNQKAQHYIKVVFGNNITIGANGNWWQDGVDTNIPVSVKGDNGLTPYVRWSVNNQIEYSYDNINWYILSDRFNTNIKIKDYVKTINDLPNNVELGVVYGVGPTYEEDDTEQINPIYRVYVYSSNGWIDNGIFKGFSAGVVQDLGDSETEVMSQNSVTKKFNDIDTKLNYFYLIGEGEGNHPNISIYNVIPGHKYKINVKTPDWDVSSFSETYGEWGKLIIRQYLKDGTNILVDKVRIIGGFDYIDVVAKSYLFDANDNIDYIYIAISAPLGLKIEFNIEDITQNNELYYYFEGATNKFNSTKIFLQKNKLYKITLPKTQWKFENRLGTGVALFNIYHYDSNNTAVNIVWADEFEKIKSEYYFTTEEDKYYYVGGRADAGEKVHFFVESISENWDNLIIPGKDTTFSSIHLNNIVPNKYYRLTLLSDSWEINDSWETDISSNYQLEFYYYDKEGNVNICVGRKFGDNVNICNSYEFFINDKVNVNEVYLGIRALSGSVVKFRLDLLSSNSLLNPHKNSIYIKGQDNKQVSARFFLQKGITYKCYLPDIIWDLSTIDLDYDYNYLSFGYFLNDNYVNIFTWNTVFTASQYKSSFEFVAEYTTEYVIYIRASKQEVVPITIIPYVANENNEISIFDEQIYKASNLGFKRLPNTIDNSIPTLSFMHISDTHCTNTSYIDPFKRAINIFNKLSVNNINQGKNLKFILHTGDVRYGHFTDGYDFFYNIIKSLNKNIYVTPGNHDVGNSQQVSFCGTDAQLYEQMIAPMLDKWNLKTDGEGIPHIEGKNYYFTDFTDEKIRLIVLYEYENDFILNDDDNTQLLYHRGFRAFKQEQIDWLINSLNTVPDNYGVIIAKHQPESIPDIIDNVFCSNLVTTTPKMQTLQYDGSELFYDTIAIIVQAFIDKTIVNKTLWQGGIEENDGIITINGDFANRADSAEFICYCSGHTHLDMVTRLKNYPNQIELNIGPNNIHYTDGTDMLQEDGNKSKNLINVYNINRNRGEIIIVRIGADFSNTGQHRCYTKIKYKN